MGVVTAMRDSLLVRLRFRDRSGTERPTPAAQRMTPRPLRTLSIRHLDVRPRSLDLGCLVTRRSPRRPARRVRRLRHPRARARRRPPHLLRPLRAPAPRAGVGGHRRRPGRPHHGHARQGPRQPGLRRAEAARAAGRHGGRPRPLLDHRARTRGRTPSPSGAPTGARSRSPTTATSSTRSSCTRELREAGVTFRSTSDSEIIAALLSTHAGASGSRTRSPTSWRASRARTRRSS